MRNNLRMYGISKQRNLSDFVTTEKDVQKGNNRLPLNLARLYEEDIMSDDEVEKAALEMKMKGLEVAKLGDSEGAGIFNQDDIMANIEHKQHAMRRKSSMMKKPNPKQSPKAASVSLYSKSETEDPAAFEDFKIIRLIGRGTFGKVYLVQN